jgi:predicted methyltransferase
VGPARSDGIELSRVNSVEVARPFYQSARQLSRGNCASWSLRASRRAHAAAEGNWFGQVALGHSDDSGAQSPVPWFIAEYVMRPTVLAVLIALALPSVALAQVSTSHNDAISAVVAKAVSDPARQADQSKDASRKMPLVMMFAEVRPGQKVLELIPGGGYFTRVFSAIVGPNGHVYTVWPNEYAKEDGDDVAGSQKLATEPHYANISVLTQPANQLSSPEPVDLVFTAQNYHDYPDKFMGHVDPSVLNKQVFAALKPGGLFVVIDHVAPTGSGMQDTDTLHRIDPAIVRQQVEAAGFVFDGESSALRNAADPHTSKVFDKSIRGHTDQFMYRFRKPAK